MKRSVLLLACIALMLGAMLALSASAEVHELTLGEAWLNYYDDLHDLRDGDEITIHRAVIPYDHSDEYGIWSDSAAANFFVEDYDDLAGELDGEPEWSVEFVDGMDLGCRLSYADGSDCGPGPDCWLRLDEGWRPQSEGVARLRVSCDWDGLHTSVYVNAVYQEVELPTGTIIPDEVDLRVNKSSAFDWRFSDGYEYQRKFVHQFRIDDSEDEFNAHFDWMDNGDGTVTIKPQSSAAGCYLVQVRNYDGNICTDQYVLFRVANSSGKVPEPEIELGYPEHVTRVCGQDDGSENTIYAHKYLFGVEVYNYDLLKAVYGGEPVFLSDADDDTGYFCFPDEYDPRFYHFGAKESYMSATTFTVHYNVYWADKSAAGETEVQYVRKTLPTGHTLPDELHFTAGETQVVSARFKPSSFSVSGEYGGYNIGVDTDYNWDQWDEDDEYTRHATFYQPGVYFANVSLELANVTVWKNILVYVADAEGNEPDVFPQLDEEAQDLEYLCATGDVKWPVYIGDWLGNIRLENYDVIEHYYGNDPWWSFYPVDEADGDYAYIQVWDDNRGVDIKANTDNLPASNHSADYVLALMMDDQELITRDIHIDFTKAKRIPTDIEVGREYEMTVGETIDITASFVPANYRPNWDKYINMGMADNFPGDPDDHLRFDCDGDTVHVTALQPGTYLCWIDLTDANIIATTDQTIIIRVKDEDGDVPEITPWFDREEQNLEFTCALGDTQNPVFIEEYLGDLRLENYFQVAQVHGWNLWWNFYPVNEEDWAYARIETRDDDRRVEIKANTDNLPAKNHSADYVLALMAGDQELANRDIHIDFVKATMPTGIQVDREFDMVVGETIEITASFLPANFRPNFEDGHINIGINDFPGDLDDHLQFDCDGKTAYVTALQPGTYVCWIDMVDGNIIATTYETVVIRVRDEHGDVPTLNPFFWENDHEITMSVEPDNTEGYSYWVSEGDVLFIHPENMEQLRGLYGDDWEWTFDTVEGPQVDMYAEWNGDDFDMKVANLNDMAPGAHSVVEATLHWGEGSVTQTIAIDFIRLSLPDEIHWQTDIEMPAGTIYFAHVDVEPADWHEGFLWYDVRDYEWCFDMWHDDENQYIRYITCDRPGTYYGDCHIHAYNVFINGPDVTYRILDENGQASVPNLILDHSELEFTAAAMAAGEHDQGLWADEYIASFGIYHADWLRQDYPDVFTGNPVWTVEPFEGTQFTARIEDWSDGNMTDVGIFVNGTPTWTTDSAYLVTCEWGGQSVSEVIRIDYRDDLPMPEGINLPHAIVLRVGESFDWYGDFEPEEYDFYERFYCEAWPHDGDADVEVERYNNDHIRFIPRQSGVIWMHANVVASNIVYSKDIRLIVLEDGQDLPVLTLPGGLREIGEEAFAGSDAFVVVVPDGCETIGSRAFADCPNLVEVQLPNGVAIAEDAFDGCPEVWLNWR